MKNLWRKDGDFYSCDPKDLLAAQDSAGIDEAHLRRRMGHGFDIWAKALSGVRLTLYEKNHVDWGLHPEGAPSMRAHDMNLGGAAK